MACHGYSENRSHDNQAKCPYVRCCIETIPFITAENDSQTKEHLQKKGIADMSNRSTSTF